jgi:exopolysaccharide biosynthesis polyprenyl glycosylphosphotransferase
VDLTVFIIAFLSLGVSLLATPVSRSIALRYQIGDHPGIRKVHDRFIPRMGGAGIISGFVVGLLAAFLLDPDAFLSATFFLPAVAGALLLIIGLGVFDDIFGVGSFGKLTFQTLASALVIAGGLRIENFSLPFVGPIDLGLWSYPLTFLWLTGISNAVNLLDGLDGLATGVSAIVAGTFLCIGLIYSDHLLMFVSTSLLFACIGFLRYNFHPASIFMGDTGSLFLGFLLACMSLRVLQHQSVEVMPISLLVAVVTLGVPIVDTSVAFFRRLKKGMHPLKPDKEHIHHRLMDLGLTHRQTVVTIYAISAFNGLVALMLVLLDSLYASILLGVVFVSAVFSLMRLGYMEELRLRRGEDRPVIKPLSVARIIDRAVLVAGDIAAIAAAFAFSYWFRFHAGVVPQSGYVPFEAYIVSPAMMLLTFYWLMMFLLGGMYEVPWDMSRIDYGLSILKTIGIGTLILFVLTLDLGGISVEGRLTTLVHGGSLALLVMFVRMLIVGIERRYEILGFRRRNTIIIGTSKAAAEMVREIRRRPGLKYNIVGFVDEHSQTPEFLGYPVLGRHGDIPEVVRKNNVEEILVATEYDTREEMLEIAAQCNGMVPSVKVVPESLAHMSGFKVEEIIGHPLIRLYPTNLKTWQRAVKRLIDIAVSLVLIFPFMPLWVLLAILIKLDSRGPVFFRQERVGKKGRLFMLYKFRSMVHEAEKDTGPVWASANDQRATRIGRLLRRFRLDEIPQFWNVLKGDMSLVGPRPERPFFVEKLKAEVGFYTRRHLVRPGITGWSQVKQQYDSSVEDVRQKIKYDLYYLENMSLTLDLKILFRTLVVALSGKATR